MQHKKEHLCTVRLPYKYDEDAPHPFWDKFLESSLEGDSERISLLQEFMGYCLGRDTSFHKALILIGEGRNGKGTTFRVIQKLIGRENFSSLKLNMFNREERVSTLVNKLVNIDADCDTDAKGFESGFRMITGDDYLTGKKLYKDTFDFKPFCKIIIGANELPRISDKTHGFYDRLIIIPYNVSFVGREDRDLDRKLANEVSGILNWALEGRKRLYEQGKFSLTKSVESYVNEIKMENNPMFVFFNEYVGFEDGKYIAKSDLYKYYRDFCSENGYSPLSIVKFGKEFYRIAGHRTEKNARLPFSNDRRTIWTNVCIKSPNYCSNDEESITWTD